MFGRKKLKITIQNQKDMLFEQDALIDSLIETINSLEDDLRSKNEELFELVKKQKKNKKEK